MIKYTKEMLSNGLTVICNEDKSTPFVAVNILYKVGSRNEDEERTGFAHLFEHLMFGGSKNAADYDYHVQMAGGESNAFTTNDYTNYYITIPAENIETALWLESDRMLSLNFSQKSLDVQKHVVIEEFKQRYLNEPYGDIWLNLRPLAYKVHPYKWPTIGKNIEHIERANLEDVKKFFAKFYTPDNAIIAISGNIDERKAIKLVKKWFGDIASSADYKDCPDMRNSTILQEPVQNEARELAMTERNVPADAIYKVYHMGSRDSDNFYCCDVISDLLSNGQSSRLYQNLIKNSGLFSGIDAYVMGEMDPSLFAFSGKLSEDSHIEDADKAILNEIDKFLNEDISEKEIQKVINKAESRICFGEINYQNKAANLAFFEYLGDLDLINNEVEKYKDVSIRKLKEEAENMFRTDNCSTLYYLRKKN